MESHVETIGEASWKEACELGKVRVAKEGSREASIVRPGDQERFHLLKREVEATMVEARHGPGTWTKGWMWKIDGDDVKLDLSESTWDATDGRIRLNPGPTAGNRQPRK